MNIDSLKSYLKKYASAWWGENITYKTYSDEDQRNALMGLRDDLEDIKTFISSKKDDFAVVKTAIDSLSNTDILDNYDFESIVASKKDSVSPADGDSLEQACLKDYVNDYMAGLDDDQFSAIMSGLITLKERFKEEIEE